MISQNDRPAETSAIAAEPAKRHRAGLAAGGGLREEWK
jgi:hypothetical protein